MTESILDKTYVRDIRKFIVGQPAVIDLSASLDELLAKIIEDPVSRHVYVTDGSGRLAGSVRMNLVVEYVLPFVTLRKKGERAFLEFSCLNVSDIMNGTPVSVTDDSPLDRVMELMKSEQVNELPVVDGDGRITGEVNMLEIITAYLKTKDPAVGSGRGA